MTIRELPPRSTASRVCPMWPLRILTIEVRFSNVPYRTGKTKWLYCRATPIRMYMQYLQSCVFQPGLFVAPDIPYPSLETAVPVI